MAEAHVGIDALGRGVEIWKLRKRSEIDLFEQGRWMLRSLGRETFALPGGAARLARGAIRPARSRFDSGGLWGGRIDGLHRSTRTDR